MRAVLSLFRKPSPSAAPAPRRRPGALPDAVLDVIDAASVVRRANGQDDAPRMMVQLPGWQPFMFTEEKCPAMMAKVFPELSDDEARQAARRLRTMVMTRVRMLDVVARDEGDARPWAQRY